MPPVTTPRGTNMPKHVLRALLVVTEWAKASGYAVKILKVSPK